MDPRKGRIVVIGASAGGIAALLEIAASLPRLFAAPVCIVQHVGTHPSVLPQLLRKRGPNPAAHAQDGERLAPGTLHVAPPDRHMLLVDGMTLRLTRGPKENHARPAIDPLFRSAALHWGARAIGVILTGQLDDGTVGLKAIADRGGTTIVQDPGTAAEPEMPSSALRNVAVDHCVALQDIGPLLQRLVGEPGASPGAPVAEELAREAAINHGDMSMDNLSAIATPSTLTCPDCGGSLWEVKEKMPLRYRCHTGHAFTALSLAGAQTDTAEHSLWSGVRALREREILLRRLAGIASATGDAAQAAAGLAQADRLQQQVRLLLDMAESPPVRPESEQNA